MDVLSDITVSSVHTSDLSSFEEESEEEPVISDSTEEGEITSDALRTESLQGHANFQLLFFLIACPNTCFRHVEDGWKKKYEPSEDDSKEVQKTNEVCVSK
ncbi:hypothetical protein ASZ78_007843 [Callipepla squamata]|uniref:Uncharacterized protein n=1 Tax=Callipepla squamata TaxID=9009 RepID=A0A226N4B7_CALSU|nr:hypothetical protein ASZ78_007843 [Callipepla squamata]